MLPVALLVAGVVSMIVGTGSADATAAANTAHTRSPLGVPVLHVCHSRPTIVCGRIEVPAYWSRPASGPVLTVHFEIIRHSDTGAAPTEPIVAMEGGPGYGSIGSASIYEYMLGPLLADHDLIVMSQRGTGTSGAIRCPSLQTYDGLQQPADFPGAVATCAAQLGAKVNAYGTDAVGDDLAAILSGLGIGQIDLYGDSYGSYAAQVFTLHHPGTVRTLVLDGTYDSNYNPFEPEAVAALRQAWTDLCARSTCPEPSILAAITAYTVQLEAHPLSTSALDPSGQEVPVTLTADGFAQLVDDATYSYTPFRDLPGALVAAAGGDDAPMARLALEDRETNQLGSTEGFSAGDLEAVSCHDYPTAWNVRADPGTRASQLSTAVAKLSPTAFAPFPDQVWLDSLDENQLVYGCLDWPQPTISDPPFPKGAVYPDTPVLILDGEFDQATPVADARKAAQAWPASTFVEVANANHVTGQADSLDCTSVILQHFMTTTTTGDTSCVQRIPPVWVVPSFPTSLAAAPSIATTSGPGAPSPSAGQAAWVAGATIGDALARFANQVTYGADSGLYGGSFRTSASVYDDAPVTLRFIGDRFVPDAALSGRAVWNRTTSEISAGVTLTGPGGTTGTFQLSWSTAVAGASVTITGTFGGAAVTGTMPAPWLASP